jgi:serine/threonine-protein kinase
MRLLNEAIALDPDFALAHAFKARTRVGWMRFGIGGAPRATQEQRVIESAERALSLDPSLAKAQLALAGVHELNWRRVAAENAYRKAFELNPNDPEVASVFSMFKRSTGEYPEAIRLGLIAVRLDPNTRDLWHQLGVTYLHAKDSDAAFRALQNALALEPDSVPSTSELGRAYLAQGDLAAAAEAFRAVDKETIEIGMPVLMAWRAIDFQRVGLQEDAMRFFERVEDKVESDSTGSVALATAYIAIREYDKAYDELERAVNGTEPLAIAPAIELKINRWERPVLNEPRFVELRKRLGFQD